MELMNVSARRTSPKLDLTSAVKGLHGLSSQELSKLIRDAENNILQCITEHRLEIQIDVEKLARYLALHLIAVTMAWERDDALFKYLLSGLRLLHSMCDLASRQPKIEQILLEDVKVSEQLIDLVFYLLIVLGAYTQISDDMVLLHSTLVACSLYLLTVGISSQWQELAQVLLAYYKVDTFLDAAFAAVRVDIEFLQIKLSADHADSFTNDSPAADEMLNRLCQQCEASLQFLQSLCQQKLLRERIVKNKELCSKGGVLLLAQAVMDLSISPRLLEASSVVATISRLKSKILSILLNLCEAESVSYLDEVANAPGSLELTKSIILEVLKLLKKMFGRQTKQPNVLSGRIYPKGQLELNAMRLADVFSDDSNFRSYITIHFTEVLTAIFSLPHGEFLSSWCSSDLPGREEDANLEYEPFAAAGWVLDLFSSSNFFSIVNSQSTLVPCNIPRSSYAHQRTSLLVKVMANLHCFVPDICKEEKDLFLNKFIRCLQKEFPRLADGNSSVNDAEKAAVVSRNLLSLLSHAESLIPSFLNEEDVQLLRVFISQLESLITPSEFEANQVEEAQSKKGASPPLLKKVVPDINNRSGNLKEGISEHSYSQEMDDLNFVSGEIGQSADARRKFKKLDRGESCRAPARGLRENESHTQNVETSGSDSSCTRGRNTVDRVDSIEPAKGSALNIIREGENIETVRPEDQQQRKRKRTVMNDKQITIIEKALLDEPEMQRNAASLQLWAARLSAHGSEVTTSKLKNWLNNRKARLARAAKDGRPQSEGEVSEKRVGSQVLPQNDSSGSPIEDANISMVARGDPQNTVEDTSLGVYDNECSRTGSATSIGFTRLEFVHCEPSQFVILVDEKAEEIAQGKVHQVHGNWYGRNLEELQMCVVDIINLKAERLHKLPHPSEVTGTTFDEAEKRLGVMRVLWDLNKLLMFPTR